MCDTHTHAHSHAVCYKKQRIEKDNRVRNQMNWQQIWCGHHWPCASRVFKCMLPANFIGFWIQHVYVYYVRCVWVFMQIEFSRIWFFKNFFVTIKICFMRRGSVFCMPVCLFSLFLKFWKQPTATDLYYLHVCTLFFGNNQFFTSKGQFATIHFQSYRRHRRRALFSNFFLLIFSVLFQIMNFTYCFSHIPKYDFLLLKHNRYEERRERKKSFVCPLNRFLLWRIINNKMFFEWREKKRHSTHTRTHTDWQTIDRARDRQQMSV